MSFVLFSLILVGNSIAQAAMENKSLSPGFSEWSSGAVVQKFQNNKMKPMGNETPHNGSECPDIFMELQHFSSECNAI